MNNKERMFPFPGRMPECKDCQLQIEPEGAPMPCSAVISPSVDEEESSGDGWLPAISENGHCSLYEEREEATVRKRILKELTSGKRRYVIEGENGSIEFARESFKSRSKPNICLYSSEGIEGISLLNNTESVEKLIDALSLEHNGTVATVRIKEDDSPIVEVTRISDRFVVETYNEISPGESKTRASFSQEEAKEITMALRAVFLHSTS